MADIPHPLPDPLAELIAQRFRVLAEPMRIKLLDQLRDGPLTVGQLQERTGGSQQNVSKHLGTLLSAGIVSREKQGTSSLYAIADPTVFELCELVCGGLRRQISDLAGVVLTMEHEPQFAREPSADLIPVGGSTRRTPRRTAPNY